jgi:hypothetical protein
MRFDDNEIAYDNSQFIETNQSSSVPASPNNQLVWLSLVDDADVSSVALVGYVGGATNGKDRHYDAFSDGGALRLYSTVESSKMAIQGRALPFDDEDLVPLGIDLPATGLYSIGIDQLKGNIFGGSQGIYLEDTLLEVVHDLRTQPYSFNGSEGATLDRFILRYTPGELSVPEFDRKDTFVFIKDQQLNVRSASIIKEVTVYDLTGKQIVLYTPNNDDTRFTAPFDFSRGMYLTVIRLSDGNEIEVTRKLIN